MNTGGYVLIDYDGKAVSIEDSTIYYWDADDDQRWNSETLQFEAIEEEEDINDSDDYPVTAYVGSGFAELYGSSWYDCN